MSISTNKLTIGYRTVSGDGYVVQRDLSFSLKAGEMVCMLGPNGCGKSTLLRTLAGLQPALAGEYRIQNTDRFTDRIQSTDRFTDRIQSTDRYADRIQSTDRYADRIQSTEVALVLTERLSMEHTTVHDVVAMGRYPYTSFLGGLTAEDEAIIEEALRSVGFEKNTAHRAQSTEHRTQSTDVAKTFFNAHSDGEKQRILIAKALAQQTPIILLDEPTAHLDLPHRILVLRLLRQLAHEQNKTVLISTHELDLALALSDRILLMTPGKGIQLDTAEHLKATDAFTSAFGMDIFNPLG